MIDINQYKEKEYMVNMGNGTSFTEDLGQSLAQAVEPELAEDMTFVINFKGIKHFSSQGFNALFDLFKSAGQKGSTIMITNVEEEVTDLVDTLTVSK